MRLEAADLRAEVYRGLCRGKDYTGTMVKKKETTIEGLEPRVVLSEFTDRALQVEMGTTRQQKLLLRRASS